MDDDIVAIARAHQSWLAGISPSSAPKTIGELIALVGSLADEIERLRSLHPDRAVD
jgi:hypothetical protein